MNARSHALLRVALPLLTVAALAEAAVVTGGTVYTKLRETTLRQEPQPAAKVASKISLGSKLKVDEVRGLWLRVSDGSAKGWVFNGNLTDTKPVEIKDLDGVSGSASDTTATAAARPLDEVTKEYASRHNLGNALADIEWMTTRCHEISDRDLRLFQEEQKKGEYQ